MQAIVAKSYFDLMDNYDFFLVYALLFLIVGMVVGSYVNIFFLKEHIIAAMVSFRKWIRTLIPKGHRHVCYVDDWDPENHQLRKFRVLDSAEDAWSEVGRRILS